MVVVENFLELPYYDQLFQLRKDDVLEMGKNLELAVRKSMRILNFVLNLL